MANETLYLKAEQNVEITEEKVYLKDVAKLTCKDEHVKAKAKAMLICTFKRGEGNRKVISILKIIELLQELFPNLVVCNLGETDILIELVDKKAHGAWIQNLKTAVVAIVCFLGTGFTIIAFHNDIGINDVFTKVHELIMGTPSDGYTILEVAYSLGLAVGIFGFFNHVGRKKLSKDPTPIEVELRVYESDVNKALIDTADREKETIDVT